MDGKNISLADMELKFIQLEKCHTSSASSCRERANLAALNPNLLAASNHQNGKSKPRGSNKPGNLKRTCPANSNKDTQAIICFSCNKPGHNKSECPDRKEGNTANIGAARG